MRDSIVTRLFYAYEQCAFGIV